MNMLSTDLIRIDGGTQARESLNEDAVAEYAERMAAGSFAPPVVVFFDGSDHWLADGFHRFHAARKAALSEMPADVRTGTKRDAILFAAGANSDHGVRRTNADKRRAVQMLLADAEWSQWSDREIGRRCCVGHAMVSAVRPLSEMDSETAPQERTYKTKHGTEATMNTEKIGRRAGPATEPAAGLWKADPATEREVRKLTSRVGIAYGMRAIACLQEIPLFDELREDAFAQVIQWIKDNR